jgi:hypothetical protein
VVRVNYIIFVIFLASGIYRATVEGLTFAAKVFDLTGLQEAEKREIYNEIRILEFLSKVLEIFFRGFI